MAIRWLARGEEDLPAGTDWLGPWERERLTRMRYAKRRVEYLTSRLAAKRAVAAAGIAEREPMAAIEVRHAPGGAPRVYVAGEPSAARISLTDRAGWAVAAVGGADTALGCDLELVEPRSPGFVRDYLTPDEVALVTGADDEERRQLLANLCWSAKESALKVLETGLRRDTRSVAVTLLDRAASGGRWAALEVALSEGGVMPGWWRRFGPFVLTIVTAHPSPPPRSLETPPRLEGATPSHSWLERPR